MLVPRTTRPRASHADTHSSRRFGDRPVSVTRRSGWTDRARASTASTREGLGSRRPRRRHVPGATTSPGPPHDRSEQVGRPDHRRCPHEHRVERLGICRFGQRDEAEVGHQRHRRHGDAPPNSPRRRLRAGTTRQRGVGHSEHDEDARKGPPQPWAVPAVSGTGHEQRSEPRQVKDTLHDQPRGGSSVEDADLLGCAQRLARRLWAVHPQQLVCRPRRLVREPRCLGCESRHRRHPRPGVPGHLASMARRRIRRRGFSLPWPAPSRASARPAPSS